MGKKFKKCGKSSETCGLKQAIDICVTINHLIYAYMESLKLNRF